MSAKSFIVVSILKDTAWSPLFSKWYNNKKLPLTFSEYFIFSLRPIQWKEQIRPKSSGYKNLELPNSVLAWQTFVIEYEWPEIKPFSVSSSRSPPSGTRRSAVIKEDRSKAFFKIVKNLGLPKSSSFFLNNSENPPENSTPPCLLQPV